MSCSHPGRQRRRCDLLARSFAKGIVQKHSSSGMYQRRQLFRLHGLRGLSAPDASPCGCCSRSACTRSGRRRLRSPRSFQRQIRPTALAPQRISGRLSSRSMQPESSCPWSPRTRSPASPCYLHVISVNIPWYLLRPNQRRPVPSRHLFLSLL